MAETAERRPLPRGGVPDDARADGTTIRVTDDLLDLSDERDLWLRRLLNTERAAYQRGFNDGRATACVALAEIEQQRESAEWWRQWSAKLRRIIQNDTDPSVCMNQVMAEIAADQKLVREARATAASKPWRLSPLESCALRRIRLEDPGDAA